MPNMDLTNQPPAPQANIVFTNEQFNELLSRLTIAQHSEPTTQRKTGHFTNCSSRFNGSKDSDVNAFIDSITIYKDCALITDENAFKGLPMLLDGFAATWYQGVKSTITTWAEAIDLLRTVFGPRKPPYRVYRELFESEQDRNTASDIFICKARSILAQLPTDTLTEATQIDMVYGLLHRRIREKVTRDSVTTFTELLQKCRLVEETFEVNTRPPIEQKDNKRPRCQYCKYIGHTKDECSGTASREASRPQVSTSSSSEQLTTSSSTSKPIEDTANAKPPIQCYKCGKPGYIRSKCPKCNGTETASLDFLSLDTLIAPRSRPIFEVSILGYHSAGLIDTAAKQSVAGSMLYDIFKKENQRFEEEQIIVKLADGNAKEEMVLVTHQDVILQGRSIATKFIIFPEATNFTLFGIDFLQDAQVILNLGENSWNFSDSPESKFPLNYESPLPCNKPVEFASLENLRPEEGTMLDEIQKKKLATLLEENEDIFQPGESRLRKRNVVADTLSRPPCDHDDQEICGVCSVTIELPRRSASEIRNEQLKDPDIGKIIKSFEESENNDFIKWTDRGYIMSNGVLYRYSADDDIEEAQLVVPSHERERVLREYHDAPTAAHYGADRTLQRIAKRYYFPGMRRYITEYVKECPDCQRYKATNQKPAGLLQTPAYAQRFETISVDLFGPLPKDEEDNTWIFIVEDVSTKWVELFALQRATAEECARTLINEIFLRFGLPRKLISDNGVQFVSAVMQKVCYTLDIKESFTPLYHASANMVERKNRDLKPRLAILVGTITPHGPKSCLLLDLP
ncbi:hypothetical protein NQ317_012697 [Molorchus minor]|uniref:RNA-directed DNA polymerase n=1 Tax=Molorchus minor TaxID=1323400 RepID=A0ABQ9IXU3_9CUCU|nr:hypothetical protein NQ317_012697 [Molorchus minor]